MPNPRNRRTESCDEGAHDQCPHYSGRGTAFSPLERRVESGVRLCPCSCHSDCPVRMPGGPWPVPMKSWYESCICPGGELARQSMEESGARTRELTREAEAEERRRKARARKEAFNAARVRAAGKNQDEIRETYTEELRARGLNTGGPRTDADVAWIAGNPLPMVLLEGKGLVMVGKGLRDFVKLVKQAADDLPASGEEQRGQEQSTAPTSNARSRVEPRRNDGRSQ
jgi:hypothetical protein